MGRLLPLLGTKRKQRVHPFGVAENGSLVHLEGAIQPLSGWDSFEKSQRNSFNGNHNYHYKTFYS